MQSHADDFLTSGQATCFTNSGEVGEKDRYINELCRLMFNNKLGMCKHLQIIKKVGKPQTAAISFGTKLIS
jgi:hypothetical protein